MTDEPTEPEEPAQNSAGKIGGVDKRVVAGIAVGSAAIAAALMFTTRYKGKPHVPPPPEPNRPHVPDASDIQID